MIRWTFVKNMKARRCRSGRSSLFFRFAIAILGLTSLAACAESRQQQTNAHMSSITGSVSRNPDVRAAGERITQSSAQVDAARAALFPQLDVNAGINGTRNNTTGSVDSERTVGFRVAMPVFNGFSTVNAVRGAEAELQAAEYSYGYAREQAIVELVTAIAEFERNQLAVGIRETELEGLEHFLNEAKQRQRAGIISATDVNQIKTQLATTQAGLSQAQASLRASRARRTALAGETELANLAIRDVRPLLPGSENEAIQAAISNNASLKEFALRQEAARHQINVVNGAFLPNADISVTGTHNMDRNLPTGASGDNDLEFRFGVTLPLFDGGARRARSASARSVLRESGYNYQAVHRDLVVTVQSIWARVRAAGEVKTYSESGLVAARDAFAGVREGRRIGARTVRDELEARKDILDAELALHDARYNELVAQHQLLLQTGKTSAAYGRV